MGGGLICIAVLKTTGGFTKAA